MVSDKNKIFKYIEDKINIKFENIFSVAGGCINDTFKVVTKNKSFFIKLNDSSLYPKMFETEALGLKLIKKSNTVKTPAVIDYDEFNNTGYLILEFIEKGNIKKNFWRNFAYDLANMHKFTNNYFGLEYDNYIGSLKQYNKKSEKWNEFFISQRLEPQLKLAFNSKKITKDFIYKFFKIFSLIDDFFPEEKPSLIHGDLWNGNFFPDNSGNAVIFDPATYFGHREMDIAMTKLFGGFDDDFYFSYNEIYPLENDWEERIHIANLYPLLVHVNLFGTSYLYQIEQIIKKFI